MNCTRYSSVHILYAHSLGQAFPGDINSDYFVTLTLWPWMTPTSAKCFTKNILFVDISQDLDETWSVPNKFWSSQGS